MGFSVGVFQIGTWPLVLQRDSFIFEKGPFILEKFFYIGKGPFILEKILLYWKRPLIQEKFLLYWNWKWFYIGKDAFILKRGFLYWKRFFFFYCRTMNAYGDRTICFHQHTLKRWQSPQYSDQQARLSTRRFCQNNFEDEYFVLLTWTQPKMGTRRFRGVVKVNGGILSTTAVVCSCTIHPLTGLRLQRSLGYGHRRRNLELRPFETPHPFFFPFRNFLRGINAPPSPQ